LKAISADGQVLEAEFSVEVVDGQTTLILESRSGDARNVDYHPALRTLLTRLAELDARLTNAIVDSTVSRRLPFEQRQLRLRERTYPVRLRAEPDIEGLRLAIGAAQESVAQRPGAKGGNRHKRIRLYLDIQVDSTELGTRLASTRASAEEVREAVDIVESVARPTRKGRAQGRGLTGPERRAVELRGMDVARKQLEADDWSVENVSSDRSYDFHCQGDARELRVEVKGTTGAGASILLTPNEVRHAREHEAVVALFVVSGIELDREATPPRATGGTLRILNRWRLDAGVLEPVGYEWVLPIER
jgi:hypothetical protein